jgi:hypothetical protein
MLIAGIGDSRRLGTHAILAGITALGCWATHQIQPLFP